MQLKPYLIQSLAAVEQVSPLEAIPLETPSYSEERLQELIYRHPDLVPAAEIEAAFENLVPVARELPLGAGYLDNLFFTPTGYPVLVEVKLWKNQEARRKVVAQILEYAKDFAALSYESLNAKVRKLRSKEPWGQNPLFEIVSQYRSSHPDETEFNDRVSRNMRQGRFLLLILGDGVREEMESLSQYLTHHSLHYAFGIVRIRLFSIPGGSVLALPDILAKTQIIERHVTVVTILGADVTVTASETVAKPVVETKASISVDGFFEQMARNYPSESLWLRNFVQSLADLPIEPKVGSNGDTLMLKGSLGTGDTASLLYVSPPNAQFWGVNYGGTKKTASGRGAVRAYCDAVAALVPGASVMSKSEGGDLDVKVGSSSLTLSKLQGSEEKLKAAMSEFLRAVNSSQDPMQDGDIRMSLDDFFQVLGQKDSRLPEILKSFLAKAENFGVYADMQGGLNLKHSSPIGRPLNMGTIAKGGIVDTGPSTWWDRKPFGLSYNKVLAGLFGGVVKGSGELRTADLKMPRLTDLLPQHEQAWLEAMEQYVQSNVTAGTNGTHQ